MLFLHGVGSSGLMNSVTKKRYRVDVAGARDSLAPYSQTRSLFDLCKTQLVLYLESTWCFPASRKKSAGCCSCTCSTFDTWSVEDPEMLFRHSKRYLI